MATSVAVNDKGFTVLYDAPDPVVDVVFVHGFTGHPKDTWTVKAKAQSRNRTKKHGQDDELSDTSRRSKIPRLQLFSWSPSTLSSPVPSTPGSSRAPTTDDANAKDKAESESQLLKDVYWPADLACQTMPNSRILTYGYDTKIRHWVSGPVSKKTVYDHAWDLLCCLEALRRNSKERRRPIIFITHSLGGIVVKEALRRSRASQSSKPHIHSIFEATSSIMFFGTPHGGADPRNSLHHLLTVSAQAFGVQANKQIVSTLMPDSERLAELRDEFPVLCQERNWLIYSFQEEYGVTALFGTKVVEDRSSCLNNFALETRQFISSNHMDMCRFSGLQDPEYSKVAAALTHVLGTIKERSQATARSTAEERIGQQSHVVEAGLQDLFHPREAQERREDAHEVIAKDTKASLLEQLYFTKIDERLTSLMAAQGKTCRWFLAKPEYICWRDPTKQPDHGGFLWIKGNPGTGKSTLMKFLFEDAKSKTKGHPSQIMLSFFFLARGTLEEKSTTGLYRSLLHQLFEKATDLQDSLEWMTADGARGIQVNGWHEEALKHTFRHAIPKLGSRSLTIFVDALDECEDSQAKDMIFFFEDLCDLAQETEVRLNICLSSRHYPHIEVKKGTELTLEDELGHKEDIEHYIAAKLRLRKTKAAQNLQSKILEKSSLIFLWVVLVIDILNLEYPGKPIDKMLNRLKEIPPELADLFEMILTRDGENPKLLQICLQCVLFATRPLRPQELYFATQFGLGEECCAGRWDQESVDLDNIKAFVRHSSKGLAEVTRNKASEVQFIHESVRDFLLGRYKAQWFGASSNFVGQSHGILRDCCLAQVNAAANDGYFAELSAAASSQNVDAPDVLPQTPEAAQSPLHKRVRARFLFLEYAALNILQHANSAQQHTMDQRAFLDSFPLREWVTVNNALEKHAVRRYEGSISLLYILAEKNMADLITIHPRTESCFDVVPEARYGPPIFAALATKSTEGAKALLEAEVRVQPVESQLQLRNLCKQYFEKPNKPTSLGYNFKFLKEKGVLSHLAEAGDEDLVSLLISTCQVHINARSRWGRAPLSHAASHGHEAVVKTLLAAGAQIDRDALVMAVRNGHEGTVMLLLDQGAETNVDVNPKEHVGRMALQLAAKKGRECIVKMLLEKGAETDNYGDDWAPLQLATMSGHEGVVKLLLEKGAEIDNYGVGWAALQLAAINGHEGILKLLLEKGADIESRGEPSHGALQFAIRNGHEGIVKILLEKGARIDYTALPVAKRRGDEAIVKLLLENGATAD